MLRFVTWKAGDTFGRAAARWAVAKRVSMMEETMVMGW